MVRRENKTADVMVDVSAEGVHDVTVKPREQARRLRRSRESTESIEALAERLSAEQLAEETAGSGDAGAQSGAGPIAAVVEGAKAMADMVVTALAPAASESRKSRRSRETAESAVSRRTRRSRESGASDEDNKVDFESMSEQRKHLFLQELNAELCTFCKVGNFEMVQAILTKDEVKCPQVASLLGSTRNLDINALTNTGETPLLSACDSGNFELVKFIIAAGALVNKPGKDGVTPLHSAAGFGRLPIIRCLVAHGAVGGKDDEGDTPLVYARQFGFAEVANFLEELERNPDKVIDEVKCEFNQEYAASKKERAEAAKKKAEIERKRKETEERARQRREREEKDAKALKEVEKKRESMRALRKIL